VNKPIYTAPPPNLSGIIRLMQQLSRAIYVGTIPEMRIPDRDHIRTLFPDNSPHRSRNRHVTGRAG